ncbi:MAG: restriction endonuclease [Pyrinomonadaceae bacterium]|nr:restriction endonuclease [Pyrinomonadaceae bacterium]
MARRRRKNSNDGCGIIVLIIIGFAIFSAVSNFIASNIIPIIILLIAGVAVYIGIKWGIPYLDKRKEKKAALQRQKEFAGYQQNLKARKQLFLQSPEYNFIQQFFKKYQNRASEEELYKLSLLLNKKQWMFSTEELKSLLIEEKRRQQSKSIKSKILSTNPITLEGYIRSFIEVCGNDKDRLYILAELLESNGIYSKINDFQLEKEVLRINEQIELELFEKRLRGNDNQVTLDDIDTLNGYEFEKFLEQLFIKMGYQVKQTKLSGDQGADLVFVKLGEKTVVQAKCYSGSVGNKAVQEIVSAINLYKAQKGMVVTNNYFTPAAIELATANNISLIDRDGLRETINRYW